MASGLQKDRPEWLTAKTARVIDTSSDNWFRRDHGRHQSITRIIWSIKEIEQPCAWAQLSKFMSLRLYYRPGVNPEVTSGHRHVMRHTYLPLTFHSQTHAGSHIYKCENQLMYEWLRSLVLPRIGKWLEMPSWYYLTWQSPLLSTNAPDPLPT